MKKTYKYLALIISVLFITLFAFGLAVFADISTREKISILAIVAVLFVVIGIVYEIFNKRVKGAKY